MRRASGPQAHYYRAVVQALEPGNQEPSAPRLDTTRPLQGSHLAAAESLLGEVREQPADLDTLVAQLVKRLANPKPDSNVALVVGPSPDPVKVCEAAVRCSARRPRTSCGAAHGRVQHPEPSPGAARPVGGPVSHGDHDPGHRTLVDRLRGTRTRRGVRRAFVL